jgi:mRNA interferase MazF
LWLELLEERTLPSSAPIPVFGTGLDASGALLRGGSVDPHLVNLDPTIGTKIRKTRPCLVVSPDEMNHRLRTVMVAPMTTKGHAYPTRVACRFKGKGGQVVLDQIRTVDPIRLVRKLGRLDAATSAEVLSVLQELFAP